MKFGFLTKQILFPVKSVTIQSAILFFVMQLEPLMGHTLHVHHQKGNVQLHATEKAFSHKIA